MDPLQIDMSLTPAGIDADEGLLSFGDLTLANTCSLPLSDAELLALLLNLHEPDYVNAPLLDPIGFNDMSYSNEDDLIDTDSPPGFHFISPNPDNSIISASPNNQVNCWVPWDSDFDFSPVSLSPPASQPLMLSLAIHLPTPPLEAPCLPQFPMQQASSMPAHPGSAHMGVNLPLDEFFPATLQTQESQASSAIESPQHQVTSERRTRDGRIPKRELRKILRPEKCEYPGCGQGFQFKGDLKKHIEAQHTPHDQRTRHSCPECGRSYARKDHVARHRGAKHGVVSNRVRRMRRM